MAKILPLLATILVLASSQHLRNPNQITPEQSLDFAKGLILGLQIQATDSGKCESDLSSTESLFQTLMTDFKKLIEGDIFVIQTIIKDLNQIESNLQNFSSVCNFDGLIEKLHSLANLEGVMTMTKNIYENFGQIRTEFYKVQDCSEDYKSCGTAVGVITRLIIDWNVQIALQVSDVSNLEEFLSGLVNGLARNDTSSQCAQNVQSVTSKIPKLLEDVQTGLQNNNYLVLTSALVTWGGIESTFLSLNKECNFATLVSQAQNVFGLGGILRLAGNFMLNEGAVSGDAASAIKNCSGDYFECGRSIGDIFSSLLGYSL